MTADYSARIDRARSAMAGVGVDALLLSVGADLPYFTGYDAPQLERLTMAVVLGDGPASLVVPRLEAMKVADVGAIDILPYDETDDPVAIVAGLAGDPRRVAIGDKTWAVFVMALQESMPDAAFGKASDVTAALRAIKDEAEIESLAAAGAASDRVAQRLAQTEFAGRPEKHLASEVRAMCEEEGHDKGWDPIVGSGPNGASPHHGAGDRVIAEGDTVVIDFGGTIGGYHADTTRTFCVGEPSSGVAAAYSVLAEAQQAGVDAALVGTEAQGVDRATRAIIEAAGYGDLFIHRTGHGIGLDIHEDPYVVEGNEQALEPGMAFTVEPGIYKQGEWGMRIEDVVVATDDGPRNLNQSSHELVVVA
ncbi:MAG: Xaa-Pro peptidase family protein [Acidimicrobiia bacterium]|nr:Xaa-Pro peptidase family protein [Acidimicrobiia bacterium]